MTNETRFLKAKQYLITAVSCLAAIAALFYISFVCALMNPEFYQKIFTADDMQDSYETISLMLSINGEPAFSAHSIRNNAVSLSEGIIRYIKKHDMSFSDIVPEQESTVSLCSAVSLEEHGVDTYLLNRLKIHPYMLGYFLPGLNAVYVKLQTIRTVYTAIKLIIPLLSAAALLIVLISAKPSYYIRITVITSCAVLFTSSFLMYIFRNALFAHFFEKAAPGISNILEPLITNAVNILFARSVLVCLLAVPAAVIFSIRPVIDKFDRISKTLAASLFVILAAAFGIHHHGLRDVVTNKYYSFAVQETVDILSQDEQAVHSLLLKLREKDSDKPVRGAKIIIYGTDTSNNPLWFSAYSDDNGDARFILPKGSFSVCPDESTLPEGSVSFGTVSINIDRPGNSWYTLHISNRIHDEQAGN